MRVTLLIISLITIAAILSCSELTNPLDINASNYEKPEIFIDSTSITFDDSTAADVISISVSGNRSEVDIRYKLDDGTWTDWLVPAEIEIDSFGSGAHTITIEGRYGEGGEIVDTALSFYRVSCPTIIRDTTDLNAITDTTLEIRHGSTCTLTVEAQGTNPLTYWWYQDSICIDSTSGDTLIIDSFMQRDSGSYYCAVFNKWCWSSTDTTVLKYLPPIQYAPEARPDSFTLYEDDSLVVNSANGILNNDSDKNNDTLTAVLADSANYGTIRFNADGTFTYTPDQDFFGTDTFTYQAKDLKDFSTKTRVTVTVLPVNDSPVIADNTGITVREGDSATISSSKLAAADVDHESSSIIFTLIDKPKHGKLNKNGIPIPDAVAFTQSDIDADAISYQHDGSESTKDTMVFSVCDGTGACIDSVPVAIVITPVNDTPYIQTKNSLSVAESGIKAIGNVVLLVKDNDDTAGDIIFSLVKLPMNGDILKQGNELDVGATFTQEDIDSLRVSYQHNGGKTDKDSLSFTITDAGGASIAETILKINVGLTDDPPVALDDLDNSLNEDSSILLSFMANDPEENPIVSYEILSNPKHGTLTGTGSSRTYTPAHNFNGTDTLTFRASDGSNWSNVAMVVITVIPQNDKPEWKQQNKDLEVKEGRTVTLDLSTVFDKDPDGDQVTFSKKSGVGTIVSDGTVWSWTPDFSAAQSSPATCVITAADNGTPSLSSDISLTITVTDSLCVLTTEVASASGSGTIDVTPAAVTGTSYDPNTIVTLNAERGSDSNYVFKNWSGDIGSADPFNSILRITMNSNKRVSATYVLNQETLLLASGETKFHGLIYHNGYYFGTMRTSPAKIMRFKADDISDYMEREFPAGYNEAEQIVYAHSTNMLYTIFEHYKKTIIAEINPNTLDFTTEKIVDTLQGTSYGKGHTMTTDGEYLYAISFPSRGLTRIVKYSLSSFSRVAHLDLSSEYSFGHSIRYHEDYLYLTGCDTPPWVAKVDPENMSFVEGALIPKGSCATDDFAISGRYLLVGTEAEADEEGNGIIYRFELNDLTNAPIPANTGEKRSIGGNINGECYAVQENTSYVWAVFATYPQGTLTRIDPENPTDIQNYLLEYPYPNEIAFDGKRFFITYWNLNPGVVQTFDPSYLNGREIPLN